MAEKTLIAWSPTHKAVGGKEVQVIHSIVVGGGGEAGPPLFQIVYAHADGHICDLIDTKFTSHYSVI